MSKQIGNFYMTETKKVLKSSSTLYCMTEGENIFLSNSYLVYRMNKYEYEMIARPVTMRDPGNWTINRGEVSANVPDLLKIWTTYTEQADVMPCIERANIFQNAGKTFSQMFYCPGTMQALAFNSTYTSTVAEHWMKSGGKHNFMVAYDCNSEPFAIFLPIIGDKNIARAVRSYYVTDETTELQEEVARLKELLEQKTMEYETQLRLNRENVQHIRELEEVASVACIS